MEHILIEDASECIDLWYEIVLRSEIDLEHKALVNSPCN